MDSSKGKILVTYHKKFPVLKAPFILPVHVGRSCSGSTKDGHISAEENHWLLENLIGDDTGDNISDRNREFSECTGLYWFWKNYDFQTLEYVGVFQYRRQLILNDLYERAAENREKRIYKCIHLNKNRDICSVAGISEKKILDILAHFDVILPYRTSLEKINIHSVYEDYIKLIPGVHISDLFILEDCFKKKFPTQALEFEDYLNSPNKLMYQIFITTPKIFNAYCNWLFEILFTIDPLLDTGLYTANGKRTLGYLAEILYGFYFTTVITSEKIFETGVTFLE